uniref:Uncharacterized protein n=1 Tax=Arion vulgaris TaxID=1028688 RepID=A0A0B7BPF6_9EUPU
MKLTLPFFLWINIIVVTIEVRCQLSFVQDPYTIYDGGHSSNYERKPNIDTDQAFCAQLSYADLKYRQVDGRCNHAKNYGMISRPVKRYIKAHYQDRLGQNSPRIYSVTGDLLPSARMVSWKLHPDQNGTDNNTMLVMQLGQFIDHDITSAPVQTATNASIKCCEIPAEERLHDCFPIPIPDDDPVFNNCMEFYRSDPVLDQDGNIIYPREQKNSLTSFIDASGVYGSDLKTFNRIRSENGKGALLNTIFVNGKERLPVHPDKGVGMCVSSNTSESYCQLAGDTRVNEQPALGSIHLLFHLHHNHIVRLLVAGILRKRNKLSTANDVNKFISDASDDLKNKLFQESRKILGGIIQKITYCDWLPIILGPELINKFKLGCSYRSKYNPNVDPRVDNGFLTAAFRFGHTLIPNIFNFGDKKLELKDTFNIPDASIRYYDNLIQCLVKDGSDEAFDRYVSSAVTEHLFEPTNGPKHALDLIALNVQRGRDHGIPGYYYWRVYYGLRKIHDLEEFGEAGTAVKKAYRNIKDVDLFPGGLLEPSVPGGVVGETFGHILANQFADLKYGDAYFFLGQEAPQGFLVDQIKAIMKVTMSSIICSNSAVQSVQINPFYMTSKINPLKPCSVYADLDVEPWMIYFSK